MTQQEILAMPAEEVYRRVAGKLWPWDESRCRVCGWKLNEIRKTNQLFADGISWWGPIQGTCKTGDCCFRPVPQKRADDPQLQSWDGVGRMVEAMREKGYEIAFDNNLKKWSCYFSRYDSNSYQFFEEAFGETAWGTVARACLLALAESEAVK